MEKRWIFGRIYAGNQYISFKELGLKYSKLARVFLNAGQYFCTHGINAWFQCLNFILVTWFQKPSRSSKNEVDHAVGSINGRTKYGTCMENDGFSAMINFQWGKAPTTDAIIENELIGPFRVHGGLKLSADMYCPVLKNSLEPWLDIMNIHKNLRYNNYNNLYICLFGFLLTLFLKWRHLSNNMAIWRSKKSHKGIFPCSYLSHVSHIPSISSIEWMQLDRGISWFSLTNMKLTLTSLCLQWMKTGY